MNRCAVPQPLLHPQSRALQEFLARLCTGHQLNIGMIAPILSPQCHLRIGNDPPSLGRDRVLRDLAGFVQRTEGIATGYFDAWRCRDTLIVETECVVVVRDGRRDTMPCAAIVRLSGAIVHDIRLYIDRAAPRTSV